MKIPSRPSQEGGFLVSKELKPLKTDNRYS